MGKLHWSKLFFTLVAVINFTNGLPYQVKQEDSFHYGEGFRDGYRPISDESAQFIPQAVNEDSRKPEKSEQASLSDKIFTTTIYNSYTTEKTSDIISISEDNTKNLQEKIHHDYTKESTSHKQQQNQFQGTYEAENSFSNANEGFSEHSIINDEQVKIDEQKKIDNLWKDIKLEIVKSDFGALSNKTPTSGIQDDRKSSEKHYEEAQNKDTKPEDKLQDEQQFQVKSNRNEDKDDENISQKKLNIDFSTPFEESSQDKYMSNERIEEFQQQHKIKESALFVSTEKNNNQETENTSDKYLIYHPIGNPTFSYEQSKTEGKDNVYTQEKQKPYEDFNIHSSRNEQTENDKGFWNASQNVSSMDFHTSSKHREIDIEKDLSNLEDAQKSRFNTEEYQHISQNKYTDNEQLINNSEIDSASHQPTLTIFEEQIRNVQTEMPMKDKPIWTIYENSHSVSQHEQKTVADSSSYDNTESFDTLKNIQQSKEPIHSQVSTDRYENIGDDKQVAQQSDILAGLAQEKNKENRWTIHIANKDNGKNSEKNKHDTDDISTYEQRKTNQKEKFDSSTITVHEEITGHENNFDALTENSQRVHIYPEDTKIFQQEKEQSSIFGKPINIETDHEQISKVEDKHLVISPEIDSNEENTGNKGLHEKNKDTVFNHGTYEVNTQGSTYNIYQHITKNDKSFAQESFQNEHGHENLATHHPESATMKFLFEDARSITQKSTPLSPLFSQRKLSNSGRKHGK